MNKLLLLAAVALPVAACADMTPTQQRAVTGTAAGAGIGAIAGAIGGNAGLGAAAGAGAGLLGGLLFDQSRQAQDRAFQQGVEQVIAVVRPANARALATVRRMSMEWVGETEKYHNLRLQVFRLRPGDLTAPSR